MSQFRKNTKPFYQERLSKDDIELLLDIIVNSEYATANASQTRLELLVAKLKRMEK